MSGSAAPPKYLLSGSADGTARLWSLDTMTNVVAYRGHQNPIWDVDWSPMGIYFATASRDRTARLWSTDRTSTLRIYAGHLSDVDVSVFNFSSLIDKLTELCRSVSGFIQIHCTLERHLVTGRHDFGMFKKAHVFEYLSDTRVWCRQWLSVRMVATLLLRVSHIF